MSAHDQSPLDVIVGAVVIVAVLGTAVVRVRHRIKRLQNLFHFGGEANSADDGKSGADYSDDGFDRDFDDNSAYQGHRRNPHRS